MLRFIARRVLVAIPLLFAASILTFIMVINIGEPQKLEDLRTKPGVSPTTISNLEHQYGLDQRPITRYWDWINGFVRGDWGTDSEQTDVRSDLWRAMQVTLKLLIFAQISAVILGIMVGLISALRQYSAFDYIATGSAFFFFSIPTFVLASLFKQFLAIEINPWLRQPSISTTIVIILGVLGLLCGIGVVRNRFRFERKKPLNKMILGAVAGVAVVAASLLMFKLIWGGNVYREGNPKPLIPTTSEATPGFKGSRWETFQDFFWHALLPSLTLITISFAGYSRFMRASMLETMNSDYVRTARAKGIKEGRTVFRHAFRNSLIPLTTQVALDFGALLAGAIITERVFAWAGMGRFFTDALTNREPYPILAFVMVTAVAVVTFNMIADILYARLDPRIRLD